VAKKNAGKKTTMTVRNKSGASGASTGVGPTADELNREAGLLDDPADDPSLNDTELNGVEDTRERINNVTSISATTTPNVVLEIDPDTILEDPILRDLRDWENEESKQQLSLPELARTIYEEGQDKPIGVFESEDGCLTAYDGHRRKRAIKIIRENWDADFPLRVIVNPDMNLDKAIRMAMLADSQQEKFTAREQARNIAMLRKRFGWDGEKGTEAVAGFLGTSQATVTQMERLARYPELLAQVDKGVMSVFTALETISVTSKLPEGERVKAQAKVVERAQEVANEQKEKKKKEKLAPLTPEQKRIGENVRKAAERDREKKAAEAMAKGEPIAEDVEAETETPTPTSAPKIDSSHVRKAAKDVLGDAAKVRAPKMSDAINLIGPWAGPAYPKVMADFAGTFEDWAHGKATYKKLEAAWDDIADELAKVPVKASSSKASTPKSASAPASGKKAAIPVKASGKKEAAAKPAGKKTTTKQAPKPKTSKPASKSAKA
jgi:ParB/RepB/Spo0J family partition protein